MQVTGRNHFKIATTEQIEAAFDSMKAFAVEALLTDNREFYLEIDFTAETTEE